MAKIVGEKNTLPILVGLILIFFFGIFLRNLYLPENLLFGYEQGRDALVINDILSGKKFTLLGPQTDIPGIYHGVLYYYYLAIGYFFAQGDPAVVILFFTLFNALSIVVVYAIGKEIFKNRYLPLLAAFFTTISFNVIIYSRWLSNVSPSILLAALLFYILIRLVKTNNSFYVIPSAFLVGILAHFELLNMLYGVVLLSIILKVFKIKVRLLHAISSFAIFIATLSPFIIFDLRHEFLLTKGLLEYLTSQNLSQEPLNILSNYTNGIFKEIINTLFPKNGLFILFVFFGLVSYYLRNFMDNKEDLKIFCLLSMYVLWSLPYVFLLKYEPLEQFYAGTSIAIIVLFVFLLDRTHKKVRKEIFAGLLLLIIVANLFYIGNSLRERKNIFYHSTQNTFIYKDQIAVWDYIFTNSEQPFNYDAFTIPYYHKESWDYLYSWYGSNKYKELVNNNNVDNKKITYLIIEPSTNSVYLNKWLREYDNSTRIIEGKQIGSVLVQKRIKK
ncbi:MAG TPA: hypothetical protein VK338_02675 [Candidatus Nitrosocosmicus sp.]|nr:hypothetical protein [Candidatus Nitrosocosmicus sp.]